MRTTSKPSSSEGSSLQTRLFINGRFVDALGGNTFPTFNPATEELLATVAEGRAEDIDAAVAAARAALDHDDWALLRARDRGRLLYRVAELIDANCEELAQLESLDNGKPIRETSTVDIPQAAEVFAYYAGWADKLAGSTLPVDAAHSVATVREPMGVCGQIIPWNFPLLMAAWKLAPALACGNTCVLKPAEQTPLTALRLAELMIEAGLPAGVVNIVPGFGPTAGAAIAAHADIDKVAFTGSTEVGRLVEKAASGNLKRVSLELGGKSPNIVFADADLDAAIDGALSAVFFNQGEVCCAGTRLLVEDSIYDRFLEALVAKAKAIVVGDPLDPATDMGAQVSEEQLAKIAHFVDEGRRGGVRMLCGGKRLGEQGWFFEPTIFADVPVDHCLATDEIFGPVLSVFRFSSFDEALTMANDTPYGLAAAVWSKDGAKAARAARALKAGTVWVNCFGVLDPSVPFGGYKQSGFGRELGEGALELYTQTKSIWTAL
jgi:aldehyde dehydrogenase (NAD+)